MTRPRVYTLHLLGSFRLSAPDGERIDIASKKGIALIAMLAMAQGGERTRGWLQDRLWGSRQRAQAQSSLRRELSVLRKQLNRGPDALLLCSNHWVKLDLGRCRVDAHAIAGDAPFGGGPLALGEFLEGFDIAGEDGFEEWLREQRRAIEARIGRDPPGPAVPADRTPRAAAPPDRAAADTSHVPDRLSARIVDLSQPTPGFGGHPALAVLRFGNHTGDPANDYLAEGISEELIDRLSRLRWLPVIARSSSFSLADADIDPKLIGHHLGARYVLEGRLRQAENGFAVAASLIDAESGFALWSQRLLLTAPHSPHALDQFAAELVALLDSRIDHAEQLRAVRNRQSSQDVRDLIWRGRWHLNRLTPRDADLARELFARALELEPNSPEALIQATFCLGWSIWAGRRSEAQILDMRKLAQRAILADGDDGRGHMLAGIAEMWLRRSRQAQALLRTAIQLNPSLALAHAQLGSCLMLAGEAESALVPLKTALRLSPNDIHVFYPLGELAMCYAMLGRWTEAIEHADQALLRRPAYWHAHLTRINALARSGDLPGARAAVAALLAAKPEFSATHVDWLPFTDRKWIDFLVEGLAVVQGQEDARLAAGKNPLLT